jgi:DNA-binding transcriptional MerR regulator
VLLIRRIRALLYDDGFTISGARNLLDAKGRLKSDKKKAPEGESGEALNSTPLSLDSALNLQVLRNELAEMSAILKVG